MIKNYEIEKQAYISSQYKPIYPNYDWTYEVDDKYVDCEQDENLAWLAGLVSKGNNKYVVHIFQKTDIMTLPECLVWKIVQLLHIF